MTSVIRIDQVTKSFGRGKKSFKAVDSLSFEVAPAQVYGFLGPNGAGKSTTIRMLLGLSFADKGKISLFGTPIGVAHGLLQQRVGALVEGATLYPYLTGRQNLEVWARTSQCYDRKRIDELLERLGMSDRADRKAQGYSTGMKQRIGIAGALLNNPQLVILDEPTNGLDPVGIQEIRQLIRELVEQEGKTVFLSSHMLHEVEQVCDRVAIVNHGKLLREGRVAELLGNQSRLMLEVEPLDSAYTLLVNHFEVERNQQYLWVNASRADVPKVLSLLQQAQIAVYQVVQQRTTLEEFFLNVIDQQTKEEVYA